MSDASRRGPVRPADALNEQIRALWARAGGRLSADERQEYYRLVAAWAAADRGDIVKAA